MLLKGRVALITGSSRGIGAAIAKGYAREGCRVVINYNKSKDAACKVYSEVKKYSHDSIILKFDVSKREQVDKAVKKIIDKYKKLDILVNNAGIVKSSKFIDLKDKDLDEVLNVNLKGSFYCAQAVSKYMIKKRYGKIINFTSISQFSPFFNSVHYAMSKSAIKMLTRCMALELGEYNIMVNSLIPGIINTEIVKDYQNKVLMKRMKKIIPLNRIGIPGDLVGTAIFLASHLSDYITGIDILVDGGFCLFKDKNPEK